MHLSHGVARKPHVARRSYLCAILGDAREHVDVPPPTILKPMMLWTGKQV